MIYLASQSPRRRQLLDQIRVDYEPLEVDIDEARHDDESPGAYVQRVALLKAGTARDIAVRPWPVLAADTAVVLDGNLLGKPARREEALWMLQQLSGRAHEVYSAVCLISGRQAVRVSRSRVCFRPLTEAECQAYCDSDEPYDKAGGYAIQGRAATFVSHLEGSYSGVMGLPLYETSLLLDSLVSPENEAASPDHRKREEEGDPAP